jgi:general secretion pathway protein D
MLQETSIKRDDKIVGLGELPLVGRLFQSRMDSAAKRNLMIFVTARLMNNDGVPVRPDALRGVPEFNR